MTSALPAKEDIKGFECKHAVYVPAQDGSKSDILFVKESIHLKDGTRVPNVRMIQDFKRDFYITKEGFRNHTDKKEWEDTKKLQKFSTNQNRLIESIGRAFGRPAIKGSLKMVANNPYLYGADITTPTLAKKRYMDEFPDCRSINSVAVLDIETDVVKGHEEPIYIGATFKDKAVLAVTKEFLGTTLKAEDKLQQKFDQYLGDVKKERGTNLITLVVDNPAEGVKQVMDHIHSWMPDFLTLWNMDFDIPRMEEVLVKYGYSPADVFSDPKVPNKYRYFKYNQGKSHKVTASDKFMSVHPADRWHTVDCPASFFIIDSMCVYKLLRAANGNEPSYGLDYQLNKHIKRGKLKFEEADQYTGLEWHQFMQKNYKIEYGIYCLFDCIGVELFDEKLRDLAQSISVQCGPSEYKIFNSQPKRLVNDLHFFALDRNKVLASCGKDVKTELDDKVISKKDWIITLPSYLVKTDGLKVVNETPELSTLIYVHVADLDVSSGYPTIQRILNMSKETTYRELSKMRGISEWTQRMAGINLTASHVNAYEIACNLFKAPRFDDLLAEFEKDIAEGVV